MVKKRTVSINDMLFYKAMEKAKRYHAGNFSAYITYLISKDINEDKAPVKESKNIAENILKKFME